MYCDCGLLAQTLTTCGICRHVFWHKQFSCVQYQRHIPKTLILMMLTIRNRAVWWMEKRIVCVSFGLLGGLQAPALLDRTQSMGLLLGKLHCTSKGGFRKKLLKPGLFNHAQHCGDWRTYHDPELLLLNYCS